MIMKREKMVGLFIIMVLFLSSLAVCAQDFSSEPTMISRLTQKYEDEILRYAGDKKYRQAIMAAAEYEQELISRYKPPTYKMGLLQSEAEHISFHCPFDSWRQVNLDGLRLSKELTMMGYNILLALEGDTQQEQQLLVFCINVKQLERRMGTSDTSQIFLSDEGLQLFAQMIAGSFGIVRMQQFQVVGDNRVLFLEIDPPMLGPEMRMILLPHDGRFFVFLLASSAGNIVTNEEKLYELVKTVSFTYKPENQDVIAAERANSEREDIKSLLRCIGRLANYGEYNAASEDLAELRLLLHSRIPKPIIEGNTAYCLGYGVELENPDSSKWKLSVLKEGTFEGVLLEDIYSVSQEGIMVGIVDFVMAYGPIALQMMNDEETSKQFLVEAGRGSAMFGGQVESERFTIVKENLAYEAIVKPNIPKVKMRVQWIMRSGYGIMVIILGDERNFQAKLAECDQIINDYLKLNDLPGDFKMSGITPSPSY
jgi:hypothetical protein